MSQTRPNNDNTYFFTANVAATNIKSTPGILGRLVIYTTGTTATLNIYDDDDGTAQPLYSWVTADGKLSVDLNVRFKTALRFVTTGGVACQGYLTYS